MTDLEAENAQLRDELAALKRHSRKWEDRSKRNRRLLERALDALDDHDWKAADRIAAEMHGKRR